MTGERKAVGAKINIRKSHRHLRVRVRMRFVYLVHEHQVVELLEDLRGGLVDGAHDGAPAASDLAQHLDHSERGVRVEARRGLRK